MLRTLQYEGEETPEEADSTDRDIEGRCHSKFKATSRDYCSSVARTLRLNTLQRPLVYPANHPPFSESAVALLGRGATRPPPGGTPLTACLGSDLGPEYLEVGSLRVGPGEPRRVRGHFARITLAWQAPAFASGRRPGDLAMATVLEPVAEACHGQSIGAASERPAVTARWTGPRAAQPGRATVG